MPEQKDLMQKSGPENLCAGVEKTTAIVYNE